MRLPLFPRIMRGAVLSVLVAQALAPATSGAEVVNDMKAQFKRLGATKGTFCYALEDSQVKGIDQDQPMRIASVAKTLTTFWAIESRGADYRFNTRLYVRPSTGEMHIQGSNDPFFDRDRLFTLIADLNAKKVTKLNRVTADHNVRVNYDATEFRYWSRPSTVIKKKVHGKVRRIVVGGQTGGHDPKNPFFIAENHSDTSISDQNIALRLQQGLNTKMWTSYMSSRYGRSRAANPLAKLPESVRLETAKVEISDSNPLKGQRGVYVFDIKSAPLRTYLKKMNIDSINPMAEELFFAMGGTTAFRAFMQKYFGMGKEVEGMLIGSGVNLHSNPRRDTTVACSTVVKMIRRMDQDLEKKGFDLSDVMMVAGVDQGTWSTGGSSTVVKTGTLSAGSTVAKNLAGVMETTQGEVYFGIFLNGGKGQMSPKLRAAETPVLRNFRPVPLKKAPFVFSPIDQETHMKMVGTIGVRS